MFGILFPVVTAVAIFYATNAASSPNAKLENAAATQKYRTPFTALLLLFVSAHQWLIPPLGFFYVYLSMALQNHDNPAIRTTTNLVCPNVSNINPEAFTWSWTTSSALAAMVLGGALRKEAFAQLESSFTFSLQKPQKLKTDGLYRFMQHPSYTGALICLWGTGRILLRGDGLLRCLPSRTAALPFTASLGVWALPWLHMFIWFALFARRIRREEKMLKAECGEEWLHWHMRTKRLLPGVW
ncbi:Protein-S-isoprenylcysteine O-methyltransferase B [Colletotrichum trifolii]|uniref:Protein-S-isoprenylcysteine O-methyltransferase B n=1 Tax=Colletotrichum trifolii TaxID=5466 RepID=A0A4R8QI62_COLTR|nr:Protein-S-isoprenylcysteine O-methyltransferase B [Colletotrichum trifolii]